MTNSFFFKCTHDVIQVDQKYTTCSKKIKHKYTTCTTEVTAGGGFLEGEKVNKQVKEGGRGELKGMVILEN